MVAPRYVVIWNADAKAFVKKLSKSAKYAIGGAVYDLQCGKDVDTKKLKGSKHYRLRIGDYRIIYDIDHGKLIITVVKAGDRKNVYKNPRKKKK